jgi:hypothetical protein
MCNLYNMTVKRWELANYYGANDEFRRDSEMEKDYVAPGRDGCVVRNRDGRRVVDFMKWGWPNPPVVRRLPMMPFNACFERSLSFGAIRGDDLLGQWSRLHYQIDPCPKHALAGRRSTACLKLPTARSNALLDLVRDNLLQLEHVEQLAGRCASQHTLPHRVI